MVDPIIAIQRRKIMDKTDNETYLNEYYCAHCDIHWDDVWDCMCNDKCPECDKEIEPFKSTKLEKK